MAVDMPPNTACGCLYFIVILSWLGWAGCERLLTDNHRVRLGTVLTTVSIGMEWWDSIGFCCVRDKGAVLAGVIG